MKLVRMLWAVGMVAEQGQENECGSATVVLEAAAMDPAATLPGKSEGLNFQE